MPALVRSAHAGFLPPGAALQDLLAERSEMIRLMNGVAGACHADDPLHVPEGHGADGVKRAMQDSGLKYAYAQRLAEAAQDAVANVRRQFARRLRGAMANIRLPGDAIAATRDPVWSRVEDYKPGSVSEDTVQVLRAVARESSWLSVFNDPLPMAKAILAFAMSRYACPKFNMPGAKASDTFVVQLRLEERMFPGYMNQGSKLFSEMNAAMAAAFAGGAVSFTWPLRLTALRGRGEFVVPVTVARRVWDQVRRKREASISGLSLEIGPDRVEVRATLKRARTTPDVAKRKKFSAATMEELAAAVNARTHLLGRDVNLVNTLAYGLVRRDAEVSAGRLKAATSLGKEPTRTFLSSHAHDSSNVVKTWHWSGGGFLDAVAARARDIDALRKRIDLGYIKLGVLKACLCKPLGLGSPADLVPEHTNHPDPLVRHLAARFHRILSRLQQLKAARIGLYRRVDAIKRCWFGTRLSKSLLT